MSDEILLRKLVAASDAITDALAAINDSGHSYEASRGMASELHAAQRAVTRCSNQIIHDKMRMQQGDEPK